jgi:quinol monooxygenase YgiN
MIIIAGHLNVPAEQRDAFVEAHQELVLRARAHPGCLDLAITADPGDPTRVYNFEMWRSEADLTAWRKVSNPPRTGIQIERASVQKHQVSSSSPPF